MDDGGRGGGMRGKRKLKLSRFVPLCASDGCGIIYATASRVIWKFQISMKFHPFLFLRAEAFPSARQGRMRFPHFCATAVVCRGTFVFVGTFFYIYIKLLSYGLGVRLGCSSEPPFAAAVVVKIGEGRYLLFSSTSSLFCFFRVVSFGACCDILYGGQS